MPQRDKKTVGDKTFSDRVAAIVFIGSLMVGAFGYGVATMEWQLFPHPILVEAKRAVEALRATDKIDTPPHFIRWEQPGTAAAIARHDDSARPDLIVMTGGFHYRPDICPEHGCLAWIMERDGTVRHRWSIDPAEIFAADDRARFDGIAELWNFYVQGTAIDPKGNLIVTFQGRNLFPYQVGVAKISRDGTLLWKRMDHSHHWPTAGRDGRIYLPSARIEPPKERLVGMAQPVRCAMGAVYEEGLRIRDGSGALVADFWFDAVVRDSDRRALAYAVRDDCDPYHINGIELVNAAGAAGLRAAGVADAREGDLVASLRSSSSFVVMDRDSGRIKHIFYGPMVAQHSPAILPDGRVLVFDNLGGHAPEGGSRIVALNPAGGYQTVFPRAGQRGQDFFSEAEGAVNASADGTRMLVAETLNGRVFEVEIATGRVLWSYTEVGSTALYAAAIGQAADPRPARHQTQGADFITRAAFERLFGG